ncbi:MAG: metallophosphoesterase [Myxococcales bacterium]
MADVTVDTVPSHENDGGGEKRLKRYRIAAVGDLHCRVDRPDRLRRAFTYVHEEADLMLLAGDLTDHGTEEEATLLAEELATVRIPKIAVLGNHDWESGKAAEVTKILCKAGIRVLDGDVYVHEGQLGIAGIKGFAGGFGNATLEPWGEEILKKFVYEAVNESLRLEMALARIKTIERRIALMHYAPVRGTIEGENPEIAPFLGCSRLADPLNKYSALAIVHGHAHKGTLKGATNRGVPVYNCAMPVLKDTLDKRYFVFEV